jgi:uncharacterized protein (TIGR02266 family)
LTDGDGSERRRDERFPVSLRVDYDDADDLLGDYTENLSAGGACIASTRVLPIGTVVKLALSFPGLVRPIAVEGVVRWCTPDRLVGIEFVDAAANERLAALVARVRDRDPALIKRALRVLVVEDNPHVGSLLQDGLGLNSTACAPFAIDCRLVGDGHEALTLLRAQRFDAMIVDVYLPGIDGPGLIRIVRAELAERELAILAMSCGGDPAMELAMKAGANAFLHKPVQLRAVTAKVRELVERRATP